MLPNEKVRGGFFFFFFAYALEEMDFTFIPIGPFSLMAFCKFASNGRKGRREMEGGGKSDQSDRFMSPSRLSSVERAHRKERSQL